MDFQSKQFKNSLLSVLLGLVVVALAAVLLHSIWTIDHIDEVNVHNSKVEYINRNHLIIKSKQHLKNVICGYTISTPDSSQTINIIDACSKWEVSQKVIIK